MMTANPVALKPIGEPPTTEPTPLAERASDLALRAALARGSLAPMYAANQALRMVEELAGMVAELAEGR